VIGEPEPRAEDEAEEATDVMNKLGSSMGDIVPEVSDPEDFDRGINVDVEEEADIESRETALNDELDSGRLFADEDRLVRTGVFSLP